MLSIINNLNNNPQRKVDLVIIDDQKFFVDALLSYLLMKNKKLIIDKYYHPQEFLKNIALYSHNPKISIDYDFKGDMNGIELAEKLHHTGYTREY